MKIVMMMMKNKNTECIDPKLPKISEEDCHATKEDFGRTAKRAGKKRISNKISKW